MATVPLSALGSSYIFQFLLLTFHLPVLGGMGEGCPFRSPLPHTQHKQRASLCPPAAFTANAVLTPITPLPHSGAHIFLGPRSRGQGPSRGPRSGVGGKGRRCSVTSHWCPLERGPEEGVGMPGGYFSIFYFQIFLYLNLQICIIPGQPIKEEYNGAPQESGVCVRGDGEVTAFLPESSPKAGGSPCL